MVLRGEGSIGTCEIAVFEGRDYTDVSEAAFSDSVLSFDIDSSAEYQIGELSKALNTGVVVQGAFEAIGMTRGEMRGSYRRWSAGAGCITQQAPFTKPEWALGGEGYLCQKGYGCAK